MLCMTRGHKFTVCAVVPEAEGKVFCYTGDTNTVEGLTAFADDADFLLADGLFTDAAWAEVDAHSKEFTIIKRETFEDLIRHDV